MSKNIKVVLSGSGSRYPVHVGGLLRLSEEGCVIEEICGSSGGAIVAAGIASGYKLDGEMVQLMKSTLLGRNNALDLSMRNLLFKWGLVKGDKIEKLLSDHFVNTFGECVIPLHIVTTNISSGISRVFNSLDDREFSLPKSVRASLSIPGLLSPVKIGGDLHVDGGLGPSSFLDIFGTGENVVGLRLGRSYTNITKTTSRRINNSKDFVNANVNAIIDSFNREHISSAAFARTIVLNTTAPNLDFDMSESDVDRMVEEGYNSVDLFLRNNGDL